jgi:rRNA maturation RNase YbeY
VQRIVLTRPAVEAGERLGFLPGDLAQKVDPYLRPLYDALYDLMGFDRVTKAFEKGLIEIAPLAFMRGRTLNHAFVILDEAQNTTREQMKMFLTRIGFGSKCVVTGDVSQIDLPKGTASGLVDARQVLRGVRGIAFTSSPRPTWCATRWWRASSRPTTRQAHARVVPGPCIRPALDAHPPRPAAAAVAAVRRPRAPRAAAAPQGAALAARRAGGAGARSRCASSAPTRPALNRDYRGKDYATNVLTFDYERSRWSWPTWCCARRWSRARPPSRARPVADHYAHLLVHGALHAQGWDHETTADAEAMEARESRSWRRWAARPVPSGLSTTPVRGDAAALAYGLRRPGRSLPPRPHGDPRCCVAPSSLPCSACACPRPGSRRRWRRPRSTR